MLGRDKIVKGGRRTTESEDQRLFSPLSLPEKENGLRPNRVAQSKKRESREDHWNDVKKHYLKTVTLNTRPEREGLTWDNYVK